MTTISTELPDEIFSEVDKIAGELKVPRIEYLRRAILAMNRKVREDKRRARIMKLSSRVGKERRTFSSTRFAR